MKIVELFVKYSKWSNLKIPILKYNRRKLNGFNFLNSMRNSKSIDFIQALKTNICFFIKFKFYWTLKNMEKHSIHAWTHKCTTIWQFRRFMYRQISQYRLLSSFLSHTAKPKHITSHGRHISNIQIYFQYFLFEWSGNIFFFF